MKIKKILSLALVSALFFLSSCKPQQTPPEKPVANLGSAKILDGKTVVVSIFANDYVCEWDFTKEEDIKTRERAVSNITAALDYITAESHKWGKNAEFIHNWEENPDLFAQRNLPIEASNFEFYSTKYIKMTLENTFDSDALLEKYDADNIFYLFIFNTPPDHLGSPYAVNSIVYDTHTIESCVINLTFEEMEITATEIAHEILHLFGAIDCYQPDRDFGVTEEYVEYCRENHPNEIMFVTQDGIGTFENNKITAELGEITAYYVGWTDYSEEADRFGTIPSEHVSSETITE